MNKKKLSILLIILVFLVIVGVVLINGYIGVNTNIIDYDSMTERVSSDYNIYSDRSFEDETINFNISTEEFNGYINRKRVIKNIDINNSIYSLNSICINSDEELVYINVSNDKDKTFDLISSYHMSYTDDSLKLDLAPLSVGNDPFVLGSIVLNQFNITNIEIPLLSEGNNFTEEIIHNIVTDSSAKSSISSNRMSFDIVFDISSFNLLTADQLSPISDETFSPKSYTIEGMKYISLTQSELLWNRLNTDSFLVLEELGYQQVLFSNTIGDIFLRFKDSESDFSFDTKLMMGVVDNQTEPKLGFSSLEFVSQDLDIDITQAITTSLSDELTPKSLNTLDDYIVIDTDIKSNEIIFNVEQTSWTIMIYLNGSDLESGYDEYTGEIYAKATEDIREMLTGLQSSNINLIIETGGTLDWKMPGIRSDINQRFKVENGELIHLQDLEMKNMTDPNTLIDFANYAIDEYPSEKYALLMWNHGGGSLYGFGVDEHFYGDSLTLDELDVALESITTTNQMIFEVIGFDACLMATLETADVCAPYGNYLIASEETEPDYGWDYDRIFKTLADGDAYDGDSFGELVVSGFIDYSVAANQEEMLTLSVIDLSKTSKVVSTMNDLINRIIVDVDVSDEGLNSVSRVIPQIKAFGGNTEYTGYTDHYDLENFAKKLTEYYPVEANRLIAAIDSAVIYKASGYLATDAGGLSFYLPFYDLYYEDQIDEMYAPVSFSDDYTYFMDKFVDYRINSTFDASDLEYEVNADNDPFILTINEQSLDFVSNVYMNVLAFYENESLGYYTDLGFDAWVVETDIPGQYADSFSFWPSLNGDYLPIQVVYHGDDYIEYETPIYLNGEQATMISAWLYEDERYAIFGARPYLEESDDPNGIVDRNTIEFVDGDQIEILYDTYSMDTGEWSFDPHTLIEVDLNTFEIQDSAFQTGAYGIQFVIEDYNGEFTFTDLYEFEY